MAGAGQGFTRRRRALPGSVSVGAYVFGNYCGPLALYDPAADRWHDISRRELFGFGFQLVAAEPVVLVLGRRVDTGEKRMLAYRPSTR